MNKQGKQQPSHWDMGVVLKQKALHMQACISSPFSIHQFQLRAQWLSIMMRATQASSELIDRNISNDLFYVFYLLGSRWISHQLASYDLLINGQYGEVTALHRMLFEVTDRITIFTYTQKTLADGEHGQHRTQKQTQRNIELTEATLPNPRLSRGLLKKG